jgi:hypothetical protein
LVALIFVQPDNFHKPYISGGSGDNPGNSRVNYPDRNQVDLLSSSWTRVSKALFYDAFCSSSFYAIYVSCPSWCIPPDIMAPK